MSKEHSIAVIPGDGIGEEVVREGLKVLKRVSEVYGLKIRTNVLPFGSEHYLKTGEIFPDSAFNELKSMSAVLLGAIGDPRVQEVGKIEHGIIMRMRVELDLYVNLRPIKLYAEHLCPLKDKKPADVDLVIVRENTEDAYTGPYGFVHKGDQNEVAMQTMVYTRAGTERIIRYAYELCKKRNKRRRLTLIDKANAVRAHDLWARLMVEVGKDYPEVEQDHAYIDAACMWMVKNPEWFDVGVAPNLFGDIITDLGAMIQGGMGIAASGNIHPGRVSMFEPIHGSAPKYKGQNKANPTATIMAVSMMLDYLGEAKAAQAIERTVGELLASKRIKSLQAGVHKTDEIGDLVVSSLK